MASRNRDVVNMRVDDVLQSKRQRELEQLATALERFHATKIAVETLSTTLDYTWKSPLDPADLKTKNDEVFQIGERVALGGGLDKLYGVNAEADLDFDSVQKLDEKMTGGTRMKAIFEKVQQMVQQEEQKQHALTVGQLLAWMNTPAAIKLAHEPYMRMLAIADGSNQPAVKLNAAWYERNLHIWNNLLEIAKPGDRIILIFGQGHAFWLRSLAEQTPGFKLVDPEPYLQATP
jgi:Holliday junction resolvasome RuvABC endonuclease subunit